jgi:replicative DNA helicase
VTRNPPPLRVLPHDVEIEAAVIGGVLTDPSTLRKLEAITVEHFYHPKHQAMWIAIRRLHEKSEPIDPVTVESELTEIGKVDAVGGFAFIGELLLKPWSPIALDFYIDKLIEHADGRRAIERTAHILDTLYAGEDDEHRGSAGLAWARAQLAAVKVSTRASGMTIGDVVKATFRELQELEDRRAAGEQVLTGVPTGVAELDAKLGGYQREILTIVGGRTRMGKSSLLLATLNACSLAGIAVHEFSLEDSRSSHGQRALGAVGAVNVADMRALKLSRGDYDRMTRAASDLVKRKHWRYDDRPALTVAQIVETYRREADAAADAGEPQLGAVTIDYLNLVRSSLDPRAPRHEKLDQVATDCANAAKVDRIAIVAATQIGRSAMNREGSRPTLEDLKESGALEERCKCAVLVHRASVYGPPVEGVDWDPSWPRHNRRPEDDEWARRADLIVAKQSNGPEGDVIATWEAEYMRFS